MICKTLLLSFFDSNNVTLFSGPGLRWLSEALHLCTPLTKLQDVQHLKDWIAETWVNLAMVDYPYESNFLQPLPAWPVKVTGRYPFITFNNVTRVYVPRFFVSSQPRFGATDIKALGASQLSGLGQTVL